MEHTNCRILVIGDVHGLTRSYHRLLKRQRPYKMSIQLGDFGFEDEHLWHEKNLNPDVHKVLGGNHDHPLLFAMKHNLGHWGFLPEDDIFYIRGARSIDKNARVAGRDWFPEEEIPYLYYDEIINEFKNKKPKTVISHDCPLEVRQELFSFSNAPSSTNQLLQACFEEHQPDEWIFGHHHRSIQQNIKNTNFVCLNELEYKFINKK